MIRWIYPAFGVLFYGFLLLGYLEFYFTADRSITFRMLMITDKQPGHSITKEKMAGIYDVPGILDRRFEDLTYGGYFELKGDVYQLTDKGKVILSVYKFTIEKCILEQVKLILKIKINGKICRNSGIYINFLNLAPQRLDTVVTGQGGQLGVEYGFRIRQLEQWTQIQILDGGR